MFLSHQCAIADPRANDVQRERRRQFRFPACPKVLKEFRPRRLHAERIAPDRTKRTFEAALDGLPDGVFVGVSARGEQAFLVLSDCLLAWSPGGYRERRRRPKGEEVRVLTPPSTAKAIRAGYVPEVHPTGVALP